MLHQTLRDQLDALPWRSDATIEGALVMAIEALLIADTSEHNGAAKTLMAILDQRGCEHMDCGPNGDGRLTQAISVCVFG